jgi:hypothetical protein
VIPERLDLGIGGCWNEGLKSRACGRYAVQLDSDDLYSSPHSLARIVNELKRGPYAMVVGSYTMVNFKLETIPPGLIDHREWTRDNGRNNALRINGLGAPRAFDTAVVREIGFPNVSYGEDYAVGLRISRDYEIGRIYDSVYLCRRWEGNSDSALPWKPPIATISIRTDYGRMKSSLVSDVDHLISSQAVEWPALARGLEGLRASRMRAERVFGRDVLVRHIPHRIKSTTAAVDAVSVAQRKCFLCPANLDPEEKESLSTRSSRSIAIRSLFSASISRLFTPIIDHNGSQDTLEHS